MTSNLGYLLKNTDINKLQKIQLKIKAKKPKVSK